MTHPSNKKPYKKPVTLNDYRVDRDYWKNRAYKQQRVIDTIKTHNNRLENDAVASKSALAYFREQLQAVCPHDLLNTKRFNGKPYCDRCKQFLPAVEPTDSQNP